MYWLVSITCIFNCITQTNRHKTQRQMLTRWNPPCHLDSTINVTEHVLKNSWRVSEKHSMDQLNENLHPTLDLETSCGLLVSTHTAVVSTVFWHHFVEQQFIHRGSLLHLVLLSRLQHLSSLLPLHWDSRFGELTVQSNIHSLLSFLSLQLLYEGRW